MTTFFLKILGNLISSLVPILTSYFLGKKSANNKALKSRMKSNNKVKKAREGLTPKKRKKIRKKYTRKK